MADGAKKAKKKPRRPRAAAGSGTTANTTASDGVPTISARRLRALAETAAGNREESLVLAVDETKNVVVVTATTPGCTPLVMLAPENNKKGTLPVILPTVDSSKIPGGPLPDDDFNAVADALFWSSSAVEKFLLPYYAQFMPLGQLISNVRDKFEELGVVAMIHLPDSETIGGEATTIRVAALVQKPGLEELFIERLF